MAVPVSPVAPAPVLSTRPPEYVARAFLHELLDFHLHVTDILSPHVGLDDQASIMKFVASLGNKSSARTYIQDLALGKFAQLTAFVSVLAGVDPLSANTASTSPAPAEGRQPLVASNSTAPQRATPPPPPAVPQSLTYATMVKRSLPQKTAPKPSKLPVLHKAPQENDSFNIEDFSLSRKGVRQYYRTAITACGHEEKAFALIKTANQASVIKNPLHITAILSKGGIREPLTIIRSPNPRQFIVFGPASSLPLVYPSYERFRRLLARQSSFQRLPAIEVQAIPSLLELCPDNKTADLLQLTTSIRQEIHRLEDTTTQWRPRKYFAEALRLHEQTCYNALKTRHPSSDLAPISQPPEMNVDQGVNNAQVDWAADQPITT